MLSVYPLPHIPQYLQLFLKGIFLSADLLPTLYFKRTKMIALTQNVRWELLLFQNYEGTSLQLRTVSIHLRWSFYPVVVVAVMIVTDRLLLTHAFSQLNSC
jgi:hypothetical protein